MEEIETVDLAHVNGGGWGKVAAKVAGRGLVLLNAVTTFGDTRDAWNESRAKGDGVLKAGAKAGWAGAESLTWPLVPLAKEAFSVRPAQ